MPTYIGALTSGSLTGSVNNIRTFGNNLENALSGFSWVRDLDVTGQTLFNPSYTTTAVDFPISGLGLQYQVWHMSDSIHSGSFPIYLKWGLCKNINNNICLELQVGTGIDSSVEIQPPTPKLRLHHVSITDTTSSSSNFCGDSGRFCFGTNYSTSANVGKFFSIERSYDTNGNETNEYVTVLSCNYANADFPNQFCLNSTGGFTPSVTERLINLAPTAVAFPNTFNGNTYISPVFPVLGYIGNPCKNVGISKDTTVGNGIIFQGVIYNNTYTYIGLNGNNGFKSANGNASAQPAAVFMRWE